MNSGGTCDGGELSNGHPSVGPSVRWVDLQVDPPPPPPVGLRSLNEKSSKTVGTQLKLKSHRLLKKEAEGAAIHLRPYGKRDLGASEALQSKTQGNQVEERPKDDDCARSQPKDPSNVRTNVHSGHQV